MTRSEVRKRVERPGSLTEITRVLRETEGPVLVRGSGTQSGWAGRVDDPELVLDTTSLSGMLTHEPADMTASMRAGTPLAEVQQHLAEHGQWIALDPPTERAGATIGGLLATGDGGPSRLGYGGLRDHVIGVTLVLADGTVARSGGHVIKNVAGYDLAKLVHGSLGTLAVVAEVVVRLPPRPATTVTAAGPADARRATAVAQALMASHLVPAAVEWCGDEAGGRLLVRFDGTATATAAALGSLTALAGGCGVEFERTGEQDAAAAWADHAASVSGADGETVLRVAGLSGHLPTLAGDLAGGPPHRISSSAALGLHTVAFTGGSAAEQAAAVTSVRACALARGESVLLRRRPPEVDALVDALGPTPPTAALLRRIAAEFDPAGRLGAGRFRPWY